ncbi:hypothetical protein CHUAL_007880 [Chamberlinius hualienensis]
MGRRSINTTKSGKFMNPTDQARKEARKKELKKNKKQRQMVRAAVLKGKDPHHLIHEMEKIDRMEFDVNNPPQLNEKVLRDKRKKLRETFSRVMKLYEKEDPEQYKDMKRLETDYETKRTLLMQYYESVKYAQQVQIEDIPLPSMQMPTSTATATTTAPPPPPGIQTTVASHIPLPGDIPLPMMHQPPPSILKKTSAYDYRPFISAAPAVRPRIPPGVPPGPPPPFSDDESDDEVDQALEEIQKSYGASIAEKSKRIRFADDDGSENDDSDMSDSDDPLTKTDNGKLQPEEGLAKPATIEPSLDKDLVPTATLLPPGPPSGLPPGPPPPGLPPMMFRPPMMRPGFPPPVRLPPGRPMGPPGLPPGLPPRLLGPPPVRLPPGPPPVGVPPPHRMTRPGATNSQSASSTKTPNVVSAPPSLISRSKADDEHKGVATIEGKPQLKNLSADITRFTPTSLRVKREDKGKKRDQKSFSGFEAADIGYSMVKTVSRSVPTKDDAYEQFMKEMEDLIEVVVFKWTLLTWGLTAAGSALVFLLSSTKRKVLDASLGFAAGVMTAASYWSLLAPAIEIAEQSGNFGTNGEYAFIPAVVGFLFGAIFIYFADKMLPSQTSVVQLAAMSKQHDTYVNNYSSYENSHRTNSSVVGSGDYRAANLLRRKPMQSDDVIVDAVENQTNLIEDSQKLNSWKRIVLLIVAITVHNIPEGLAVGVGFGAIGKTDLATFERARNLAIGIGIQNFPEGLAVSLPLKGAGFSKWKSFWYGQLSGMVEPIAGLLGAFLVNLAEPVLPYSLAFAAGAMIYVVMDDIIPEANSCGNGRLATWGSIVGFVILAAITGLHFVASCEVYMLRKLQFFLVWSSPDGCPNKSSPKNIKQNLCYVNFCQVVNNMTTDQLIKRNRRVEIKFKTNGKCFPNDFRKLVF